MKRSLSNLFAALLLCCVASSVSAQFSGSGSGTADDPYRIYNAVQLNQVRNFVNKDDVYFSLEADIDMTDWIAENNPVQGWQPIGNSDNTSFRGNFDGNGHTISNLLINRPDTDYIGLFGYVYNGTISDLTLSNINYIGSNYTGGIVGCLFNDINNTVQLSQCSVVNSQIKGKTYVGGIIGWVKNGKSFYTSTGSNGGGGSAIVYLNIVGFNCFNAIIEGVANIGGLFGSIEASPSAITDVYYINIDSNDVHVNSTTTSSISIEQCFSECTISGNDNIGGIVGIVKSSPIAAASIWNEWTATSYATASSLVNLTQCTAYGEIKGKNNIGGIVGYGEYMPIEDNSDRFSTSEAEASSSVGVSFCYSNCKINGDDYIGGIIGRGVKNDIGENAIIKNNYVSGIINGKSNIGGIDSYDDASDASYCYSQCISILGDNFVTGIGSKCNNSVAINTVIEAAKGENLSRVGPGSNNLAWTLTTMIANGERLPIPADDAENGTSTGLSTLKLQATYEGLGWDFNDIWKIEETESFPYFQWQTAPPYFSQTLKKGDTHLSGQCTEQGTVTVRVGDKRYTAQSAGNAWSVDLEEPLNAGDMVEVWVQADDKMPSYVVCATAGLSGSGTETDPYLITSAEDLQAISDITDESPYYRLTADIDLAEYISENGWNPIALTGNFDGQGHTVSGLQCEADIAGLFRILAEDKELKNLKVEISADGVVKGGSLACGLVGNNKGTITNCTVSGNVEGEETAGGIAGENNGKIADCSVNGEISGATIAGGIAGVSSGSVSECYTKGNVSSSASSAHMGGIVGENSTDGNVSDCYSDALTDASGSNAYGGGIVGYNYGNVENCYAAGDVTGYTVAGVCGYNSGVAAALKGCVAGNSNLSGSKQALRVIGGFSSDATAPGLTDNYAVSDMVVSVNGVPQTIYDDPLNGTAMPESELMKQSTYEALGWNFTNVWKIDEGQSYPYLPQFAVMVSEIVLDKTEAELMRGETLRLSATVLPDDARNKTVKWTSSNDKIATVDADGVVKAIAIGEATITATAADGSGMSATCKIKVTPKLVTSIELSKENLTLEKTFTAQLTATVFPEDADDRSVTWSSGNNEVATVSQEGLVTAVGVGTADISVKANDGSEMSATCKVTVTPKLVTSITLGDEKLTIVRTHTKQLAVTVLPEDADDLGVVWSSGNEEVATVDDTGLVTALKVGEASITATANDGSGVTATCVVTVTPKLAESISLNETELTLERTATAQLTATVLPETADDRSVTWSSGNTAVAKVDEYGMVTAVGVGETTIIATTNDGTEITAICKVTVTPKLVEQISLSKDKLSLENGTSAQLTVTVLPQDADDSSVTWTSNNTMVATVDATGRVSAVGVGTAVITATTNDGSNLSVSCTVTVSPKQVVFISLDKTNLTLRVDESALLTATVLPEDAGDRSVTWTSSDGNVATVNSNGVVTALGIGEADITAAANDGSGVAATCHITVLPIIAKSITLDKTELVLIKGRTDRLTPVILPNNTTDKSVTWTSTDDNVVTVDDDGNIEAIGEGTAEVTATTNDGSNLSATCKVTVIDPDGRIYGVSSDGISVFVKDDRIFVAGKDDDEVVTVHTLEGRLVYRGTDNAVDVYSNVFYLVTVRGTTYKVFIP